MRYEIELWDKKGNMEILGNLDGQAIYRDLKTLKGVLNRLKKARPLKLYRNNDYEYRIFCNDKLVLKIDVCDIIQ